jgi:hypothetical protein
MTLGSTQPLTAMSTRNISWGKGGRSVGMATLPPSCVDCLEIWTPQPPETLRPVQACNGTVLPCTIRTEADVLLQLITAILCPKSSLHSTLTANIPVHKDRQTVSMSSLQRYKDYTTAVHQPTSDQMLALHQTWSFHMPSSNNQAHNYSTTLSRNCKHDVT